MLGIALSRSEYTNGMVFCNPIVNSFSTSADYLADKNRHAGEVFLLFNTMGGGGKNLCFVRNKTYAPTKFTIGEQVFVQDKEMYDILEGTVDDSLLHDFHPSNVYDENNVS